MSFLNFDLLLLPIQTLVYKIQMCFYTDSIILVFNHQLKLIFKLSLYFFKTILYIERLT